jgi:hypothetical protein
MTCDPLVVDSTVELGRILESSTNEDAHEV